MKLKAAPKHLLDDAPERTYWLSVNSCGTLLCQHISAKMMVVGQKAFAVCEGVAAVASVIPGSKDLNELRCRGHATDFELIEHFPIIYRGL